MPIVVIFTKFDLIVPNVSSGQNDYEERCLSLVGNVSTEIVSSTYSFLCVAYYKSRLTPLFLALPRFHDLIDKLVQTTDRLILAHSRNISAPSEAESSQPRLSPVSLAWSVSQRVNRDINIQAAIE